MPSDAVGNPKIDSDDESHVANNSRTTIAIKTADLLTIITKRHLLFLDRIIFSRKKDEIHDQKKLRELQKKLASPVSLEILKIVWKETNYISDPVFVNSENDPSYTHETLSKRRLAKLYCEELEIGDDFDKFGAVQTDIGRIITSAEIFGLVRQAERNGPYRPLYGTALLDKFMIYTHFGNAETIDAFCKNRNENER